MAVSDGKKLKQEVINFHNRESRQTLAAETLWVAFDLSCLKDEGERMTFTSVLVF